MSDIEPIDLDKIERACQIAEIAKTGCTLRAYELRYLLDIIAALRARLDNYEAEHGKQPRQQDYHGEGTA